MLVGNDKAENATDAGSGDEGLQFFPDMTHHRVKPASRFAEGPYERHCPANDRPPQKNIEQRDILGIVMSVIEGENRRQKINGRSRDDHQLNEKKIHNNQYLLDVCMNNSDLERLVRQLPEVPGIYGKKDFFNSAVLVSLVPYENDTYHFLFEKRANHIRQGGEICFPGGAFDAARDQDFQDTAIRETVEELGIHRRQIRIIGVLDTIVASVGLTVDSFVGIIDIDHPDQLSINHDEVEKVFTLPVSDFEQMTPEKYQIRTEIQPYFIDKNNRKVVLLPSKELGLPERYHEPWGCSLSNILVYRTDYGMIWGITAALVQALVHQLQEGR
jgi:8-oxo-dGTP pyrophosphatase MutT (NUDIX family)